MQTASALNFVLTDYLFVKYIFIGPINQDKKHNTQAIANKITDQNILNNVTITETIASAAPISNNKPLKLFFGITNITNVIPNITKNIPTAFAPTAIAMIPNNINNPAAISIFITSFYYYIIFPLKNNRLRQIIYA
jgi:hypothetical protein